MATLKDIAKVAGVSISTASRALNNSMSISDETRKLVQDIAEKMNYRSNRMAPSIDSSSKKVIAVIVPYITPPFFSTLISGIQDAAITQEYSIMLYSTEMDRASEKKIVDLILSMNVAGVIIAPPETEQTYCQSLHDALLPVVYVGYRPSTYKSPMTAVSPDDYAGAEMATEYLISQGMKSIILFTGPTETISARNRADGYLNIMNRYGLTPSIYTGPFTYHAGLQIGLEMFGQPGKLHADAVIAGADEQAIGFMHALNKIGLRIPDDISLISFEDTFMTSLSSPELTSVSFSLYSLGAKSVSSLLKLIEDNTFSDKIELISPVLMKRKSCMQK